MIELDEKKRIIQEFVPGKQVTLAHVIANPTEDLYLKLGLIDASGAIGIFTITLQFLVVDPLAKRCFAGRGAADQDNASFSLHCITSW